MQLSRIVQLPRSSKQPDVPGVDTHGNVVLVEVVVVVDVLVLVVLVELDVVVVLLDVVVATDEPQCASRQVGSSPPFGAASRRMRCTAPESCWAVIGSPPLPLWFPELVPARRRIGPGNPPHVCPLTPRTHEPSRRRGS